VIAPEAGRSPAYAESWWGDAKRPERGGLTFTSDDQTRTSSVPSDSRVRGEEGGMTNEAGGPREEEVQVESVVAAELDAAEDAAVAAGTATRLPRAELFESVRRLLPR